MDLTAFDPGAARIGAVSARAVQLRTGLKNQVHAVLGKEGVIPHLVELWGPAGDQFLDDLRLAEAYRYRVRSLRDLIGIYGAPIRDHYRRIAERRGTNIGRVAAARKLLTLVFYGLRDGEIRCLRETGWRSDTVRLRARISS